MRLEVHIKSEIFIEKRINIKIFVFYPFFYNHNILPSLFSIPLIYI